MAGTPEAETMREDLERLRSELPVLRARFEGLVRVIDARADVGAGGGEIDAILVDADRAEREYERAKRRIARIEWVIGTGPAAP